MRVGRRSAAVGILSPLAAASLAFGTAAPALSAVPAPVSPACTAAAQCTALLLGGTGTGSLTSAQMKSALDGYFGDDARFTRKNVKYPGSFNYLPSIGVGALNLYGEVNRVLAANPNRPIVIGGFSQGSSVADQLMYRLELADGAPARDQLRFVLVADPFRGPNLGQTNVFAPESKYDIILVAREYDGIADSPDRWWNGVASMNAALGALYLHVQTANADLDDVPSENITVSEKNSKGGTITKYLVPTETLPLIRFMPWLKPFEATLQRIVDRGYSRNDDDLNMVTTKSLLAAPKETTVEAPKETTPEAPTSTEPVVDEVEDTDVVSADLESVEGGAHRALTDEVDNSVSAISERLDKEAKAAKAAAEAKRTEKVAKKTAKAQKLSAAKAASSSSSEGSTDSE